MKTSQLGILLVASTVSMFVLGGIVPPLMNAHSTAYNALGAIIGITTVIGALLISHHVFFRKEDK